MSGTGAGTAVQQPYIPTDAEQAEHLQNLIRKLKEFWVEQLAEMETLSLATEQVRVVWWRGWKMCVWEGWCVKRSV